MSDLHRLKQTRKYKLAELQAKIEQERKHLENAKKTRSLVSRGKGYNSNPYQHKSPSEFAKLSGPQWLWLDDSGIWNAFEANERDRIEHSFLLNKKTVPFLDGLHFLHTIDIVNMTKVDMRTGHSRKVKRVPEYGYEAHCTGGKRSELDEVRYEPTGSLDSYDTCVLGDFGFLSLAPFTRKNYSPPDVTQRRYDVRSFGLVGNQVQSSPCSRSVFWSRYGDSTNRANAPSSKVKKKIDANKGKNKLLKKHGRSTVDAVRAKIEENQTDAHDYIPLQNWLKKFGLFEECFEKLKTEKVTLKELKQLSEEQMRSIGLSLGSLKRLSDAIQRDGDSRIVPNEFLCPITTTLMADPVVASDGFTYERMAISKWLEDHDRSPLTNERLGNKDLTPNRQLKKLIEDHGNGNVDL